MIFLLLLIPFGLALLVHHLNKKMAHDLIEAIKARGHFEVNTATGEGKWIPGTWKTPQG